MTQEQRDIRELRRWLKCTVEGIEDFVAWMDVEMKKPSDFERGRRIAKVLNQLDMIGQQARMFGILKSK